MTDLKPADALRQQVLLGPPASSPASLFKGAHAGWRSRGYLPHCDAASLIQHIVFGLADALPPQARGSSTWHWDHALDRGHGSCLLRQARCAEIVENSILQADGERVRLLAWCVMPNHVHIVAEQIEGHPLANVIQAWKSASSHQLNRELGRKGRVWRREYFDRYMRDQTHLETAIAYVEENPIKAKLIDRPDKWRWSSAWRRSERFAGEDAGGPRGDQG